MTAASAVNPVFRVLVTALPRCDFCAFVVRMCFRLLMRLPWWFEEHVQG
jgi:hypothetical protein